MSIYQSNNDGFHFNRRTGTHSDPFVNISEPLKVNSNKVVLKEIPDTFNKLTIKNANVTLTETKSEFPGLNQYYVDYPKGHVIFNEAQNNLSFNFTYTGTGVVSVSASRIFLDDQYDSGIKTLQELVDQVEAKDVIDGGDFVLLQTNTIDGGSF